MRTRKTISVFLSLLIDWKRNVIMIAVATNTVVFFTFATINQRLLGIVRDVINQRKHSSFEMSSHRYLTIILVYILKDNV